MVGGEVGLWVTVEDSEGEEVGVIEGVPLEQTLEVEVMVSVGVNDPWAVVVTDTLPVLLGVLLTEGLGLRVDNGGEEVGESVEVREVEVVTVRVGDTLGLALGVESKEVVMEAVGHLLMEAVTEEVVDRVDRGEGVEDRVVVREVEMVIVWEGDTLGLALGVENKEVVMEVVGHLLIEGVTEGVVDRVNKGDAVLDRVEVREVEVVTLMVGVTLGLLLLERAALEESVPVLVIQVVGDTVGQEDSVPEVEKVGERVLLVDGVKLPVKVSVTLGLLEREDVRVTECVALPDLLLVCAPVVDTHWVGVREAQEVRVGVRVVEEHLEEVKVTLGEADSVGLFEGLVEKVAIDPVAKGEGESVSLALRETLGDLEGEMEGEGVRVGEEVTLIVRVEEEHLEGEEEVDGEVLTEGERGGDRVGEGKSMEG